MSKVRPKISILTATHNSRHHLGALYSSLAGQTYKDFEWLVLDGASTDGTLVYLQELAEHCPWIRFISEPDFGCYDALNRGLAMAEGEYYLVVGSDDALEPHALACYADSVRAGEPDVILARVKKGGKVIGGFRPKLGWISHAQVFQGSHSVGMLFRKALHLRFGTYSSRFPLLADGYFLKKMLRSGSVKFKSVDFVAGTFADDGMSSRNKLQILAETWQIQMLTERSRIIQTIVFLAKIIMRYRAVRDELSQREERRVPSAVMRSRP